MQVDVELAYALAAMSSSLKLIQFDCERICFKAPNTLGFMSRAASVVQVSSFHLTKRRQEELSSQGISWKEHYRWGAYKFSAS